MAISLQKGGNVNLSKESPGLAKVIIGLGWDPRSTDGAAFDLDGSAFLLKGDAKVRGDTADQNERDEAGAEAGGDQRQRGRVVGQLDDLQRHHDRPHALGEDRQRNRRDQQPVLADGEGCEHAPAAGAHRLLGFELRTHTIDGRRRSVGESTDFPSASRREVARFGAKMGEFTSARRKGVRCR